MPPHLNGHSVQCSAPHPLAGYFFCLRPVLQKSESSFKIEGLNQIGNALPHVASFPSIEDCTVRRKEGKTRTYPPRKVTSGLARRFFRRLLEQFRIYGRVELQRRVFRRT